MAEAIGLLEKHLAIVSRMVGIPREKFPMRTYRTYLSGSDSLHTIIFEVEWDSLAAMAEFFEKVMADRGSCQSGRQSRRATKWKF